MKKVKYIFLFFNIELCCAYCYFLNLHNGHKILSVNDEESLKKENIIIENYTQNFNENAKKISDLKNIIENEINEIDKIYEKVYKDTSNSFLLKHEELIKEENDLKEKLQTEVTKIKEKLEEFLSNSNELIKNVEKINKGIKILEKEEKNLIKTLSYISKINKNQKEMKKLIQELMKNIKITYNEEENNIKYEEYYFNGIVIPKNIEFKDISSSSANISWNIDNITIKDVDNNKMKYIIEMRKENEKFEKVYEGNNKIYSINITCVNGVNI